MFTTIKILSSKKDKPKYLVTIIRGLPGSGKTNLIYNLEKDREKVYSICNSNNYFYDDENEYNFKTVVILQPLVGTGNKQLTVEEEKYFKYYDGENKIKHYQLYADALTKLEPKCTATNDLRNIFD